MASLQAYRSHGIQYYRIVESFRNNGKPSIRVLAHLGRVDDILQRHQQQQKEVPVRISSVSAGAVTAIHHLAQELDLAGRINRTISPDRDVQVRDALTVGESLVAAMIARACAPPSKRAFADWAKTTHLPDLMHFTSSALTSQHFWDQMNAVPVDKLAVIEQELVREVVRIEQLQLQALAYDTTNFYTHIASTNLRPKLPQRGKNGSCPKSVIGVEGLSIQGVPVRGVLRRTLMRHPSGAWLGGRRRCRSEEHTSELQSP